MKIFGGGHEKADSISSFNEAERTYAKLYGSIFEAMGLPADEARQHAAATMLEAIRESKIDGTYRRPEFLGDLILGDSEPADNNLRADLRLQRSWLPVKRDDGVTDDDIRGWWNQPEVARRMRISAMNMLRSSIFVEILESRKWEDQNQAFDTAARMINQLQPFFGHPTRDMDLSDLSRPLPFELDSQLTRFVALAAPDEIISAGSVNALYRMTLH